MRYTLRPIYFVHWTGKERYSILTIIPALLWLHNGFCCFWWHIEMCCWSSYSFQRHKQHVKVKRMLAHCHQKRLKGKHITITLVPIFIIFCLIHDPFQSAFGKKKEESTTSELCLKCKYMYAVYTIKSVFALPVWYLPYINSE